MQTLHVIRKSRSYSLYMYSTLILKQKSSSCQKWEKSLNCFIPCIRFYIKHFIVGNDPSTDLRGAGLLGLLNLIHMLRDPKKQALALDIYKLSLHPTQVYFYMHMQDAILLCTTHYMKQLISKLLLTQYVFNSQVQKDEKMSNMLFWGAEVKDISG